MYKFPRIKNQCYGIDIASCFFNLSSIIDSYESLAKNVLQMDRCMCILFLDTPPEFLVEQTKCGKEGRWESNGERFRKKEDKMSAE